MLDRGNSLNGRRTSLTCWMRPAGSSASTLTLNLGIILFRTWGERRGRRISGEGTKRVACVSLILSLSVGFFRRASLWGMARAREGKFCRDIPLLILHQSRASAILKALSGKEERINEWMSQAWSQSQWCVFGWVSSGKMWKVCCSWRQWIEHQSGIALIDGELSRFYTSVSTWRLRGLQSTWYILEYYSNIRGRHIPRYLCVCSWSAIRVVSSTWYALRKEANSQLANNKQDLPKTTPIAPNYLLLAHVDEEVGHVGTSLPGFALIGSSLFVAGYARCEFHSTPMAMYQSLGLDL